MYFKTLAASGTGKKFAEIATKAKIVNDAQRKLAKKYGFDEYRPAYWVVWGGFSSCIFKKAPDTKIWKNVLSAKNEWMPRLNTKEGKLIAAEFKSMPVVEIHELNMCIGFDGYPFKTIGYAKGEKHFGFIVGDEWKVTIPADCTEITKTEYDNLFK